MPGRPFINAILSLLGRSYRLMRQALKAEATVCLATSVFWPFTAKPNRAAHRVTIARVSYVADLHIHSPYAISTSRESASRTWRHGPS